MPKPSKLPTSDQQKQDINAIYEHVPVRPYDDFRKGASWRIFRIMAEFIEGFEFLADLKKEVSVFGSTRVLEDNPHYKEAQKLGYLLGKDGFTIITGGGPGIMEAANRGANEAGAESVGLNIQLPNEQRVNKYVTRGRGFYYFFTRKVMLDIASQAYVFFPGGYGTLDELFELMELIQTKKSPLITVVLVGKDYWESFRSWIKENTIEKHQFIDPKDLDIFTIVETAEEAYEIVRKTSERPYLHA